MQDGRNLCRLLGAAVALGLESDADAAAACASIKLKVSCCKYV